MPEFIKTAEVVGNIAERVFNVGKFVVDRLQGGAWAGIGHEEHPSPANIQVHEGNIVKGDN